MIHLTLTCNQHTDSCTRSSSLKLSFTHSAFGGYVPFKHVSVYCGKIITKKTYIHYMHVQIISLAKNFSYKYVIY